MQTNVVNSHQQIVAFIQKSTGIYFNDIILEKSLE